MLAYTTIILVIHGKKSNKFYMTPLVGFIWLELASSKNHIWVFARSITFKKENVQSIGQT